MVLRSLGPERLTYIREILGGVVKRSCDYPTRVLEYTKERQVLVLDNRLQSYSTPNEGFEKNEVDGIENIHDAAYVHIQSFVLLKDLIRGSSLYVHMFTSQLVAHNPRVVRQPADLKILQK